jgi:hypothetical protein
MLAAGMPTQREAVDEAMDEDDAERDLEELVGGGAGAQEAKARIKARITKTKNLGLIRQKKAGPG